jgi:VanZ family protein
MSSNEVKKHTCRISTSARAEVAMKRVRSWLPAVVWAATIFVLSSIPGRSLPPLPMWNADKLVHAAVYAVLGALCWRGARASFAPGTAQWRVVLIAVLLTSLYGIADEVHQMFVPNRSPDPNDVLADAVGGWLGALACVVIVARRGKPSRHG